MTTSNEESFDIDLLEGELELDDYKKDKQQCIQEMNKVMDQRLAKLQPKKVEQKVTVMEDREENSQLLLRP